MVKYLRISGTMSPMCSQTFQGKYVCVCEYIEDDEISGATYK
jgi:hypothetical protein